MPFQFFKLPVLPTVEMVEELNRFLRSQRVLSVQREFVASGETSFWALCVDYVPMPGQQQDTASGSERVDYKAVLPAEQFEVFARLRQVRKEVAERDGVPVFAVFSNEQLAEMVKRGCRTPADLRKINGIGEARVEKYATPFLAAMVEVAKPSA